MRPSIAVRIALWLALWLALAAAPAWGHAVLLGTEPADRAAMAESPREIVLRFSEAVRPVFVRLLDAGGRVVADGAPAQERADVRLALPAPLPAGQYLVSYRVISSDAHPVAGTLLFAVGAAPGAWASPALSVAPTLWLSLAAANRALHFLALALAAGASVFLLLASALRDALRTTVAAAVGIGVATALLAIPFQGGVVLDAPAAAPWSTELWRAGLDTTQARQSGAALILLVLLWASGWRASARGTVAPAVVAAALLATVALTGHVVTAGPAWLTVPALLGHTVPALLWIGSFVPLLVALRTPDLGSALVPRFARAAAWGVALLLAAGLVVAWLQVHTWGGLTDTAYGNTLLLKSVLVGGLLALAAHNRLRLTPRLHADPVAGAAALRRSIALELALGAAILAITAVLAQTPPPRSLAQPGAVDPHAAHGEESPDDGYAVGAVAQGRTAIIAVVPARAGQNTLTVALRGQGWAGPEPLEVSAALSNPAAGIEPIVRKLMRTGAGIYELSGPELAIPGEWTVKIDVLINDFEKVTYTAPIPVR